MDGSKSDGSVTFERWSRRLLALAGIAFVFTGLTMFLLPDYAAENFPWSVSPLVAATVGGWALGLGLMALDAVRSWSVSRIVATALAVWSFSVLELLVILGFAGQLRTDQWLTWPFVAGLLFGSASALLGLPVAWRQRAALRSGSDDPGASDMPRGLRLVFAGFAALVFGLGLATLIHTPVDGGFFPEPLSPFTTRVFSAFFVSLGIGALPLLIARDVEPAVEYARTGLYLMVLTVVAALSYLHVFDFGTRPGGLVYLGLYIVAAAVAIAIVGWHRRVVDRPHWRHLTD